MFSETHPYFKATPIVQKQELNKPTSQFSIITVDNDGLNRFMGRVTTMAAALEIQ